MKFINNVTIIIKNYIQNLIHVTKHNNNYYKNYQKKKVTQQQNENLVKQISTNEIKEAIFQMENQESPGIDGLPIEYYKEFYEYLKDDLSQLFNNILFTEKQSLKTMNQEVITLIPKKNYINDPDLNDVKNWRPVSLLCLDYKILTKILANRLQKILPDITSEEQNCCIPKRPIFNNVF